MWSEICEDYIPFNCYLVDINGDDIDRGTICEDNDHWKYEFKWDGKNQEWVAISKNENDKEYPMYQERVNRNNFKVVK